VYEGSFLPTSSPTSVVSGVFKDGYFNRGKWNLSVVLICISFMARDGEHFCICFFAIWISFFEKVLFCSVAHFFIGSLILGEFRFLSSLYIVVTSPLSDV
jgi:hypothetical protein